MRPEDLNLFDILERDEPRWDDDEPVPVRFEVRERVYMDGWTERRQHVLVRWSSDMSAIIDWQSLDDVDLSTYRKVSR